MGGYLRSSQVIGRSLELQLACEQRARSRAEAEVQGLGVQRVRCSLDPPYLLRKGPVSSVHCARNPCLESEQDCGLILSVYNSLCLNLLLIPCNHVLWLCTQTVLDAVSSVLSLTVLVP